MTDLQGALTQHEAVNQAAVTVPVGAAPGGKVDLEGNLLGDWGNGVVLQGIVQGVAAQGGVVGQPSHGESMPTLGTRGQNIPGPLLTAEAAAASSSAGSESGQG